MRRWYILIYLILTFSLNCSNSEEETQFEMANTRPASQQKLDTTASRDSVIDEQNPILAELTSEYNWETEKKEWRRNPFESFESKVTARIPKSPKKTFVNEAAGLKLSGIIQVKNTRKALINGRLYTVGSSIENLKIIKIKSNSVTLKSTIRTYKLVLRE
ncbi:hypothetical protein GF337_15520 [candidate division KSB1 bacterium]|nr:hypothetical protein [candidate division KSB1 bacterium]